MQFYLAALSPVLAIKKRGCGLPYRLPSDLAGARLAEILIYFLTPNGRLTPRGSEKGSLKVGDADTFTVHVVSPIKQRLAEWGETFKASK